MKKITFLIFASIFMVISACSQNTKVAEKTAQQTETTPTVATQKPTDNQQLDAFPDEIEKVEKTGDEWRKILTAEEYRILREEGTERAFTGKYWDNKKEGTYYCSGCGLALFESDTKFKSGTGWPSFYQPVKEEYVTSKTDNKFGWNRTEVLCARCDGHLGHVFDDGPAPTGLRYCINGNILTFKENE